MGRAWATLLALLAPSAGAWPQKIVFFRHAEKADGLDNGGLTAAGAQHASDWADFFTSVRDGEDHVGALSKNDVGLVAMRQKPGFKKTGYAHSNRPWLTLQPLAKKLQLSVDQNFTVAQSKEVAAAVAQGQGKLVLVCWEHDSIPLIVNELLHLLKSAQAWERPSGQRLFWNRDFKSPNDPLDFDTVWVLDTEKRTLVAQTGCHVDAAKAEQRVYAQLKL